MKKTLIPILALAALMACGKDETKQADARAALTKPAVPTPAATEAKAPHSMPMADKTAAAEEISGTVAESIDSAGFTYVRLATNSGEQWLVLSPTKLAKGEKVVAKSRMVAEKFESKSLGRSFGKVTFADLVSGGKPAAAMAMPAAQMPAGHPMMKNMAAQHASAASGPGDVGVIDVPKAEGADAKTVEEVWAARTSLGDSKVVVRGKVVKSLSGVMGRTWIHIRDGSGSRAAGNDDLTVTTNDPVKVGDVVLVSGVVRVDKDFGAGYRYPVIVENASVRQ